MKRTILILLFALACTFGFGQTSMRSGLVGYWKMETTSFLDQTNNSNDGTNNGVTIVTGKINDCGDFDGSSDDISISNDASLIPVTSAWSISTWIKPDNIAQSSHIINKRQTGTPFSGWSLMITNGTVTYGAGKRIVLNWLGNSSSLYKAITTTTDVVDGNWHHVVGVVDYGNSLKIYIDGVEATTSYVLNTGWGGVSVTNDVYVGSAITTNFYTGLIDEIMVHRRDLSALEVSNLYNSGTGLFYVYDNWINKKITDEEFSNYYWDYLGYANTGSDSTNP